MQSTKAERNKTVFISHSSSDSALVVELTRFLQLTKGLSRGQIVSTSKAEEIPSGAVFVELIRDRLMASDCVYLLVTPDYLESKFCLAEMGAAWGSEKLVTPLLVPPMNHRALNRTPLRNAQCRSIGKEADLYAISDELDELLGRSGPAAGLAEEIDRFLETVRKYEQDSTRAREAALDRSVDRLMTTLALKNWRVLEERATKVLESIEALKNERYRVLAESVRNGELTSNGAIWRELESLRDHYGELDDTDDLMARHNPEIVKLKELARTEEIPAVRNALVRIANPRTSPIDRKVHGEHLAKYGDPRCGVGLNVDGLPDIDWVEIPEGPFLQGLDKDEGRTERFFLSRYPVTNAQFRAFVEAGAYSQEKYYLSSEARPFGDFEWPDDADPNKPVVNVSWHEADAFCRWLSEQLDFHIRLPTAREWEKAARGTNGREYPYGNQFDPGKGNTRESNLQAVVAVGLFPHGISPYRVHDLGGLVWNWTDSFYQYNEDEGKILKGGSFRYQADYARAFSAGKKPQSYRSDHGGFRLAFDDPTAFGNEPAIKK